MTRVKICGITNGEDAQLASESGADAIGLVFYPPSPRNVSFTQAQEVVASLPPFVTSVALFVNAERAFIEQVIEQVAVDVLQFHGDETPEFCAAFRRPYLKAIRMKNGLDLSTAQKQYSGAQGLLLDTYVKGVPGGTGAAFNWQMVPQERTMPIILAGGLQPENIARAIAQVNPYAVDVSGGVEASRGKKDRDKIIRFMAAVKGQALG